MTKKRIKVGEAGEKAAKAYLENLGFRIIETNYRCPLGEIYIIALDQGSVIVVEVRTKTGTAFGSPEESITTDKARRLHRLAHYYIQAKHGREVSSRIDLVAVTLNRDDYTVRNINHIRAILSG